MTFAELNRIVIRNDYDISFKGSGFFMSRKYGMLGKQFETLPDKLLIQMALKSIRNFNLLAYNRICDTTSDTFCLNIDGTETNIYRIDHYTGKFGDKLRFTQTDYNADTDEVIDTRVLLKDYDLKTNCIITADTLSQLISKY